MNKRGFTLVELLVTISIFTVISLSLFINYPQFREGVSLKRTAQEIALSIRQAQVYGLSVKEFEGAFPGYGVHFDINNPDRLILFVDIDNGNDYDGEPEKEEEFKIRTKDRIFDLCGNKKTDPPGNCDLETLDIVYLRPGPQVTLSGDGASGYSDLEIVVRSPGGNEKTLVIWSTGQIEVE